MPVYGGGDWPPSALLTSIVMKSFVEVPKSNDTVELPSAGIVLVMYGC